MAKIPLSGYSLQTVVNMTGGTSLVQAFALANPSHFDPNYEGNKDSLLCFRNYGASVGTGTITFTRNLIETDDYFYIYEYSISLSDSPSDSMEFNLIINEYEIGQYQATIYVDAWSYGGTTNIYYDRYPYSRYAECSLSSYPEGYTLLGSSLYQEYIQQYY